MRRREFNPDDTLGKAMELFWQKGYKSTSMRDLVAHTGVSHEGLYGVFGNKEQLFQAALERYAQVVAKEVSKPLERPDTSLPDIRAFFAQLLGEASDPRFRSGCLACNAAFELADEMPCADTAMRRRFGHLTELFRDALKRARERGEIAQHRDPDDLADFLSGTMIAMALMVRAGQTSTRIERFVKTALSVLE